MYTISEFSSSTKSHEIKYHRFKKGVATENVPSCTGHRFKFVRFKFHHLFPLFFYHISYLIPRTTTRFLPSGTAPARRGAHLSALRCSRLACRIVEYVVPISVVWYELCYTRLVTRNPTHTWRLRLLLPPCSYPFLKVLHILAHCTLHIAQVLTSSWFERIPFSMKMERFAIFRGTVWTCALTRRIALQEDCKISWGERSWFPDSRADSLERRRSRLLNGIKLHCCYQHHFLWMHWKCVMNDSVSACSPCIVCIPRRSVAGSHNTLTPHCLRPRL
jgi:hypothetical protein